MDEKLIKIVAVVVAIATSEIELTGNRNVYSTSFWYRTYIGVGIEKKIQDRIKHTSIFGGISSH